MNILKGVRPLDYVLAAVMVAIAVFIGVENVTTETSADVAHPLDSHSWLMVPVFVLAALPVLWRRRGILAAIAVSFVVVLGSVLAFGWVTRCGFGLPLSVAMAYAVARFAGSRQRQLVGAVGVVALQVVVLVKDASTGGLGALALAVPVAAAFYGIGFLVRSRTARGSGEPTVSLEHVNA
ncbi:MAG TPA: hypothetical protein VGC37_17265 [Friedmanniella sp.]